MVEGANPNDIIQVTEDIVLPNGLIYVRTSLTIDLQGHNITLAELQINTENDSDIVTITDTLYDDEYSYLIQSYNHQSDSGPFIKVEKGAVIITDAGVQTSLTSSKAINLTAYNNDVSCTFNNAYLLGMARTVNGANNTATVIINSGTFTPATEAQYDIADYISETSTIVYENNTAIVTKN